MQSCCGVDLMPIDLTPAQEPPRKEWVITGRFVLVALVLFFVVIAAVNAVMMTMAIRTFPGIDARNGYEVSQRFNKEIAAARAQSERGWDGQAVLERVGGDAAQMRLALTTRDAQPISGLAVEVRLKHPSDRRLDHVLTLNELAPGRYEAATKGLASGAWGLDIEARNGAETVYRLTSRVTLKD